MERRCQSQSQRAESIVSRNMEKGASGGETQRWRRRELAAGGGEAIQMMRCTLCKVVFGENFSRKITIFKHENITFNFFVDLHNDFNMIISEKLLAQCTYQGGDLFIDSVIQGKILESESSIMQISTLSKANSTFVFTLIVVKCKLVNFIFDKPPSL